MEARKVKYRIQGRMSRTENGSVLLDCKEFVSVMLTSRWRNHLFGDLQIQQDERVITRFRTQKTGVLLACLAFQAAHSHTREHLVELLWPEDEP